MKKKIGIFFGQGKYKEQDIEDLESRIVEITPEIEQEYSEEIKLYKEAVEQNTDLRVELVWDK